MTPLFAVLLGSLLAPSAFAADAATCGTAGFSIAGSSTVYPIAVGWAEGYRNICPGLVITIDDDGSSAGAARVCNASNSSAVQIGDMSRDWKEEEGVPESNGYVFDCTAGDTSRSVIQIDVALDGITVVSTGGGIAATCIQTMGGLTIDQLRWMFTNYTDSELLATGWDPKSLANSDDNETTHLWSELDSSCEATEIKIFGLNSSHGTYDYFSETLFADLDNGEGFSSRYVETNIGPEETVTYVEANTDAVAYVGYSYYYRHGIELYAAAIQNDKGEFVTPNADTVVDGSYNPLSRTIYMNLLDEPDALALTVPYVTFGFSSDGTDIVSKTGYVPIPNPSEMLARLSTADAGSNATDGGSTDTSLAPAPRATALLFAMVGVSVLTF